MAKNGDVTDIVFRKSAAFYKVLSGKDISETVVTAKDLIPSGDQIQVNLSYAKANGGGYGNTTVISADKKALVNAARYEWGGAYASQMIDLEVQLKNSGSPAARINMIENNIRVILDTIRDALAKSFMRDRTTMTTDSEYGGDGAAAGDYIYGIQDMLNTTTSTAFAGIAQDDMSTWSAANTANAVPISYKIVSDLCQTARVKDTNIGMPDLIVATYDLLIAYKAVLQSQQQFQTHFDKDLWNAGFDNVLHDNIPMVGDYYQQSGYLTALNTKHLQIKTHKDYNFLRVNWEKADVQRPDALLAHCRWVGQMVTDHRASHGQYTGVTTAV
jgi:hypothetical protein